MNGEGSEQNILVITNPYAGIEWPVVSGPVRNRKKCKPSTRRKRKARAATKRANKARNAARKF